ncbi:hypothetical protein CEXT_696071 [Caerostris extrusa]|uniref:Uncharacterized protein n=1 Tax=Caerostris extrusa TaxID=172846 RepID=A0AAV4RXI6_CAEEX|nr:hypothetical protein CEXT_696071 [Caerostris extrusa]
MGAVCCHPFYTEGRESFPTRRMIHGVSAVPLFPLFVMPPTRPIRLEISFGTGMRGGYPGVEDTPSPLSMFRTPSKTPSSGRDLLDWIYVFPLQ